MKGVLIYGVLRFNYCSGPLRSTLSSIVSVLILHALPLCLFYPKANPRETAAWQDPPTCSEDAAEIDGWRPRRESRDTGAKTASSRGGAAPGQWCETVYCNPLLFQCRLNFGNFGASIFLPKLNLFFLRLGHCYYFLCFSSHQNSKSYAARWKKNNLGQKNIFFGSPPAQAVLETVCSRHWLEVFLCNTVG